MSKKSRNHKNRKQKNKLSLENAITKASKANPDNVNKEKENMSINKGEKLAHIFQGNTTNKQNEPGNRDNNNLPDKDNKSTENNVTNLSNDSSVNSKGIADRVNSSSAVGVSGVKLGEGERHNVHYENTSTVNVKMSFSNMADESQLDQIIAFNRMSKEYKDNAVRQTMRSPHAEWSLGGTEKFIITTVGLFSADTEPGDYRYVHESIQTLVNFLSDIGVKVNYIDGTQVLTEPVNETWKYLISDEGRLIHVKE